ncbi:zinc finger CCCH domain-containing protein 58-like [Rutidosis leptorrhynchoides]|uniref:zinc finger CCCH domain-containing protein 58-like n=1 Tax=Rutidosis leptorrhynchoides TaxID=125765 RepID=UPI003A98E163
MELYGRGSTGRNVSQTDHNQQPGWIQPGPETGLEESMRRFGIFGERVGELYPERPGMADCAYYMRTGTCGYGSKCRYNHPPDRSSSAGGVGRLLVAGPYPERPGEPICQYYLRTGTCKFGASCKFNHPRHAGGSLSNVPLNTYGYPLRPEEKECSYYLKTGQCKFGITCKYHHPQPTGEPMQPASARPFYSTVQSPSAPSPEPYGGPVGPSAGYRVARPPLVPGSYPPGAYGPILLSPGMVPVPNWSPYSGRVSPALSPGAQPSVYGVNTSGPTFAAQYRPLPPSPGPGPGPISSSQTERIFPERPGQPECQYYMKTGDCKFGASCKYHHPPDWALSKENCLLSPMGLPLRPGVEPCSFYMQNGHCKFGRTCKFDHPIPGGAVSYGPTDIPIAPYMTMAPSGSFPERSNLDPHSSSSVGLMFPHGQPGSSGDMQLSSQSQSSPQTR